MLGNPPKITDKPTNRIINNQLDIKLEQFTDEELDAVLKKIKIRKAVGLDEISQKHERQRKLMTYFFNDATLLINKMQEMDKRLHPPLSQERWPRNHYEQ